MPKNITLNEAQLQAVIHGINQRRAELRDEFRESESVMTHLLWIAIDIKNYPDRLETLSDEWKWRAVPFLMDLAALALAESLHDFRSRPH